MFVDFDKVFHRGNPTAEFTASMEFNHELFQKLFGMPKSDKQTFEFDSVECVPRRKHKKWRIQKKWLKRYGYKEIKTHRSFQGKLVGTKEKEDGEFEFEILIGE